MDLLHENLYCSNIKSYFIDIYDTSEVVIYQGKFLLTQSNYLEVLIQDTTAENAKNFTLSELNIINYFYLKNHLISHSKLNFVHTANNLLKPDTKNSRFYTRTNYRDGSHFYIAECTTSRQHV